MFSCFIKNRVYNKTLSDYYSKITNASIIKLTEKYNLEKNNPKCITQLDHDSCKTTDSKIYNFLLFLSISTITFYFYKRLNR
jgi:hypothetical protein